MRDYLIGHARRWLERGVDGFRLDHAHGSTHAFWSAFRAGTRAVRPDSVTFGEITETPAFMRSFAGRMDGCLDFRLLEILRAFFAFRTLGPYAVILNNSPQETMVSIRDRRKAELVLVTEPTASIKAAGDQLYLPPYAGAVCWI